MQILFTKYKKYAKGADHPAFKHGLSSTGYRRIKINKKMVYEHIYVMEEKLNRKLKQGEINTPYRYEQIE